ncbi:DNRLRE domain-containing protein, partial [Candidatus Woesearchaeota archaeon]|nr:DNRLRE domain-containing protein [Candidatus Woesearchaeota archaeon]
MKEATLPGKEGETPSLKHRPLFETSRSSGTSGRSHLPGKGPSFSNKQGIVKFTIKTIATIAVMVMLLTLSYFGSETPITGAAIVEHAALQPSPQLPNLIDSNPEPAHAQPTTTIPQLPHKQPSISLQGRAGNKLPASIKILDTKGHTVAAVIPARGETRTLHITPQSGNIKQIIIYDANISNNIISIDIEELTQTPYASAYHIDPSRIAFSNATITVSASPQSHALYKCANWTFSSATCNDNRWEFLQALTPGTEYNITINATDPGFIETQNETTGTDTWLDEANPIRNFGADTIMRIGNNSERARGIIHIPIDGIPTNASVNNANYSFEITAKIGPSTILVNAYRLTSNWTEGTRTGLGANDGASWNENETADSWNTPGGDYDNTTIWASVSVSGTGRHSLSLTNLLRAWQNSTFPRYGIILISSNESSTATYIDIASGDHPTATSRPIIELNWTEHEATPPTLVFDNISQTTVKLGDTACIAANVTDTSGIASVIAKITKPDNTTINVTLSDIRSCNSKDNDGIFSSTFTPTIDGIHRWTNITVADIYANTQTIPVARNFSTSSASTALSAGSSTPKAAFYHDNSTADIALINTSNNVYITQGLSQKYLYINFSPTITNKNIKHVNFTIEHNYDPQNVSVTLEWHNTSTWQTICQFNGSLSDIIESCTLTPYVNNLPEINGLQLRINANSTSEGTENIDYTYISYLLKNQTARWNVTLNDLLNNTYTTTYEFYYPNGTLIANTTTQITNLTIDTLVKTLAITPNATINRIILDNLTIENDISTLINIDETPNNASPYGGELYAVNVLVNYTNATVSRNANPDVKTVYKCTNWSYNNRSCLDNTWMLVQTLNNGGAYNFTLTETDPGFIESQNATTGIDVWLDEGTATKNFGGDTKLHVGLTTGNRGRALIALNLSTIPSNATITSAYLNITPIAQSSPAQNVTIQIYRLLRPFTEGTKLGTGAANGATWNS